jgi:hypothetical protein
MGKTRNQAKIGSRSYGRHVPGRQPPPNYFSRKEQYRLLLLCATLMFVLAMMNEARKPSTWNWMWGTPTMEATASAETPVNTRLKDDARSLPPDGFTLSDQSGQRIVPPNGDIGFLPGISDELPAPIQDNTVMRAAENEAWQTMLHILGEMPQDEITSLSSANIGFAQLFRQTEIYRGHLITVKGTTHRVEPIQPRDNEAGIEQLFRWIIAPGGGSNSPIVIYSLEKPDGIAMGDDAREEVEFTGFCFKRWAYEAGDGTRVAPLILAKTATWYPPKPAAPARLPSAPMIASGLLALVVLATIIALVVYKSSVVERPEVRRMRHSADSELHELNDDEILPSTSAVLRKLSDSHENSGDTR